MTGPVDGGQNPIDNGGVGAGQQDSGIDPSWNEYLKEVPQEFHEKVIPAFKAWDSGVQQKLQKVQSDYEPWKGVIQQTDPQTASWAINVANALSNDPQMVYEALGEWIKQGNGQDQQLGSSVTGQGQQQQQLNSDQDNPYAQQIAQLQRQNQMMVDYLQAQRNQQLASQMDAQLDQDIKAAQQQYGLKDADMPFVLGLMAGQEVDMNTAAQAYIAHRNSIAPPPPAPLIMGSGGGALGQGIDPKTLDDKGRKDLVIQMLQAAEAQNR